MELSQRSHYLPKAVSKVRYQTKETVIVEEDEFVSKGAIGDGWNPVPSIALKIISWNIRGLGKD